MIEAGAAAPATNPEETDALGQGLIDLGFERSARKGAVIWTGQVEGRETTIVISIQSRTQYAGDVKTRRHLGFRLRIQLSTTVPTRLYLVVASFAENGLMRRIYRWRRQQVLTTMPAELSEYRGVAKDLSWGRSLLERSEIVQDIAGLIEEKTERGVKGSVYFEPGELHYGSGILARDDFEPDWVASVLDRLGRIAATAESIPPPRITEKIGRIGQFTRDNPAGGAIAFLGAIAVVGLGLSLLVVGALFLFVFFLN
ncbi:MAG: hypothetical protein AAGE01_09605 [Pseudomonadota bacterium]